ncbi:2619_t:CDS:1, partial [Gigaspora rosea]
KTDWAVSAIEDSKISIFKSMILLINNIVEPLDVSDEVLLSTLV